MPEIPACRLGATRGSPYSGGVSFDPSAALTPMGGGAARPPGNLLAAAAQGVAAPPISVVAEELPVCVGVVHLLAWQLAAFLGLTCHILLVREGGVALTSAGPLFLALLYARLPLAGLGVFLQVLLYQNWFLGVFSDGMDPSAFQVLQGTAFLAVAVLAVVAAARVLWLERESVDRRVVALARLTCAAIAVAAAYTVLGALRGPPASAAVYFRATVSMLLALLVGLDVGRTWSYRTVAVGFLIALAFGLVLTACEVLAPLTYYEATGAVSFMNHKYGPANQDWPLYTAQDVVNVRTAVLFNITGSESSETSFRFGGPNQHPISYSYVLAVAAIVAVSLRQTWLLAVFLALLMSAGVKGSVILLLASVGLHVVWRTTASVRVLAAACAVFTAVYIGFGLAFGLANGDFHVIGFVGGVMGLLQNPIGHGIGVGGNLSADAQAGALAWQTLQHAGATDFALESAVGVLLYQMGVGTAVVLWAFAAVLRAARLRERVRGTSLQSNAVVFIGLAVAVVNGVYQEEAYSPYALGLLMLLGGVLIANGSRSALAGGTLPLLRDIDAPRIPRAGPATMAAAERRANGQPSRTTTDGR
jgi:hypothetical protein